MGFPWLNPVQSDKNNIQAKKKKKCSLEELMYSEYET